MKAMIFAAGLGSRLKPLTDTMPKALIPIGGVPLLELLIRKMIAAGITEIIINVHHFAQQIIAFVQANHSFGITIHFSDERGMLLETGGAIKKAVNLLSIGQTANVPFLVHNVDILSNLKLYEFMQTSIAHAATLLVSERDTQRYLLFNEQNRLVGWTNVATGQVKSPYENLDIKACKKYAFAGIHMFSPQLFPYFERWGECFSVIDFYLSLCDKEPIYGCPMPNLQLLDVGKPATLQVAQDFLKSQCC